MNREVLESTHHVLVLPSSYEAMPLVIAETLAMGKPVVATDVGNNREVVELTGGGVICPVGDISALMRGINQLLRSKPDPTQIRKAILSRFDIQIIAKQYENAFFEGQDD